MKKIFNKFKELVTDSIKHDKPSVLILKAISIIAICIIVCIIIKQLIPILFVITVFLIIYFDDIKCHLFPQKQQPNINDLNIVYLNLSEPICRLIRNNADVLSLVKPNSISEIQAVRGDGIQSVSGIPFFRYIVMKTSDSPNDFAQIQEILQLKLQQALQSGQIPNVQYPFYNNLSYIQIINVDDYLAAQNYIAIDVMLLNDEASYQYVCRLHHEKLMNKQITPPDINDKDF